MVKMLLLGGPFNTRNSKTNPFVWEQQRDSVRHNDASTLIHAHNSYRYSPIPNNQPINVHAGYFNFPREEKKIHVALLAKTKPKGLIDSLGKRVNFFLFQQGSRALFSGNKLIQILETQGIETV